MPAPATPSPIDRLLGIMRQLRNPDGGCEWDLAQDFSTIAPYTIEEAYEVSDAIAGGDPAAIRSEEHTSELQSLMRISYAVFCLKKKTKKQNTNTKHKHDQTKETKLSE